MFIVILRLVSSKLLSTYDIPQLTEYRTNAHQMQIKHSVSLVLLHGTVYHQVPDLRLYCPPSRTHLWTSLWNSDGDTPSRGATYRWGI